jgi:uncharacterized protein (DUF302 family)
MTERVDLPYEEAVASVTEALANEGFGVLHTIDVRGLMREKLEEEFPPYAIFEVCNPALAYMVLRSDADAGLLLPCKVVVRCDPDTEQTIVSILDPMVMVDVTGARGVDTVSRLVREKMERVLAVVKGGAK